MYDRLKAHGAEILQQGIGGVSVNKIKQIAIDAFDSDDEQAFMVAENPEIATGINSWSAYLSTVFCGPQTLSKSRDKLASALNKCILQLSAVAFEAGYHAGKARAPLTEDEVQKLFERREE